MEMKVLILSDTHRMEAQVEEVISRHNNEVDFIIHCGDSELPTDAHPLQNVLTVKGNCDIHPFPEEIIYEHKGKVFYVTHGHIQDVKNSLMSLMYRSEEVGADIVCFGHSHMIACEKRENTLFINPGSLKLPRQLTVGTYAIYALKDDGKEIVTYLDVEGNVLKDFTQTF